MEKETSLQEQIKNAPQEIKNFLAREVWSVVANQVAQKNNLSPEQKTALENEILFVILGMELAVDFEKNIQNALSIPENITKEISKDVYQKVFREIEIFLPKESEDEPVETKLEINKEAPKMNAPQTPSPNVLPEIPPANLPIIEPGEIAHDVPHVEMSNNELGIKNNEVKKDRYPGGKDPYREPLA